MHIRPALGNDAAAVLAIYAPIVTHTAVSFEEEVPDIEEIAGRIHESIAWLVCEDAGRVVGYAYAGPFHPRAAYRWSAEVSLYVARDHRQKGVGRLLLDALLVELRRQEFANALAGIALPNDASVKLFESFGFRRVAFYESVGYKLGRWHDVGWWQLRLAAPDDSTTSGLDVGIARPDERADVDPFLHEQSAVRVARLGELVNAPDYPALVARKDGRMLGVLTYVLGPDACEILTLHTAEQWKGAGTALIEAVEDIARHHGCARIFLITTNDNVDALRFYQKRGFSLRALHRGAVDDSRARFKPEIPQTGDYGIPLRDELELEKWL